MFNKIIVTGGAGFIGGHITETLVKQGYSVRVIDNLSTGKKENLKSVINKIEFVQADIRDLEGLKNNFSEVDTVFHQAALRSVPASLKDPQAYIDVNVIGTYNVLEAARVCGVKRVVFASSSSVYGDLQELPQKEDKTGTRLSPYAISKYTGEDLCKYFWKTYELETVVLRYFNVFGARQDPFSQYAAVIPLFILALKEGKRPTIFGDGTQTRDFTYVVNVVRANILAMNAKTAVGETINVANGEGVSVNDLFEQIRSVLNKDIKPICVSQRKGDVKHTKADTTELKKLGYEPAVSFDDALRKTVEWHNVEYK